MLTNKEEEAINKVATLLNLDKAPVLPTQVLLEHAVGIILTQRYYNNPPEEPVDIVVEGTTYTIYESPNVGVMFGIRRNDGQEEK